MDPQASRNFKGAGLGFLGTGGAFLAIGISGQAAFIGVGGAFLALGIAMLARGRRQG